MLTQALLQEILTYDPETGELTWKKRGSHFSRYEAFNTQFAGKLAFTATDSAGYKIGSVFNRRYRAHRIIWLMVHGELPEQIDHENGMRSDNRLANLRPVTDGENKKNMKLRADNVTGCPGVKRMKTGGYSVSVGKRYVGFSTDLKTAIALREAAAKAYGYHENHGRK